MRVDRVIPLTPKTKPKRKSTPINALDLHGDLLDVLAIEHTSEPVPVEHKPEPPAHRVILGWVAMHKDGKAHTGPSGAGAKIYKSEALAKSAVRGNRRRSLEDFEFSQAYVDLPTTK